MERYTGDPEETEKCFFYGHAVPLLGGSSQSSMRKLHETVGHFH